MEGMGWGVGRLLRPCSPNQRPVGPPPQPLPAPTPPSLPGVAQHTISNSNFVSSASLMAVSQCYP